VRLWRAEDEWPRDILILREPISTGWWRGLKNSLVRARIRQRAVLCVPALWDATEAPKSVPKPTPKHVCLVDGGHGEWLKRRNRESEDPDSQTDPSQGVGHSQLRKKQLEFYIEGAAARR
jgi:hypothetical protein